MLGTYAAKAGPADPIDHGAELAPMMMEPWCAESREEGAGMRGRLSRTSGTCRAALSWLGAASDVRLGGGGVATVLSTGWRRSCARVGLAGLLHMSGGILARIR